ncbi:MAG: hypothetical protein ABR548_04715 [Actinomycetota bacterium]|nr:hypothetical protein [Actinomycetota bacterium]
MDGGVAPPPKTPGKLGILLITIFLGCAGSMTALAVYGHGTYVIGHYIVKLSVEPAAKSTTELEVDPLASSLSPGRATANTHSGFLKLGATVFGVTSDAVLTDAVAGAADPRTLATKLKDDGEDAGRRLAIKILEATAAGGAIGGALTALFGMRVFRVVQGAVAGVLLVALLGVIAWRTYDVNQFSRTSFAPNPGAISTPSG